MAFIPALVIQDLSTVQINSATGAIGVTQNIPTPASGGFIDGDYWATPQTSFGIVGTGFKYTPCSASSTDSPDAQSFHVVRIINQNSNNPSDVYVLGTSVDYNQASEFADCCGTSSPAVVMPTSADLPVIAPCTILCNQDDNGDYFGVFAAPTPDTGTYAANGYYNDTALPQVTGATVAALTTALNNNGSWSAIGTWTNPSGATLVVTQSGADGTDVLCMVITVG